MLFFTALPTSMMTSPAYAKNQFPPCPLRPLRLIPRTNNQKPITLHHSRGRLCYITRHPPIIGAGMLLLHLGPSLTFFFPDAPNMRLRPTQRKFMRAVDIIRVEATTAAPFRYVDKPQGCIPMTKGPGFGSASGYDNPTAQVVLEYEIKTMK